MTDDDLVRRIADAVLYEGYILWPYRRSALKNQRRWTFGGVYPPAHAHAHPDDPALMRAECLVEGPADATVDVRVRFLHVVARGVARTGADGTLEPVDELVSGGDRHIAWEEAAEREIATGPLALGGAPCRVPLAIAAGSDVEPLDGGALVRAWHGLAGALDVGAQRLGPALWRVRADVVNTTALDRADGREAALAHTFCSTHAVLHGAGGAAFVSLTDPPEALRAEAEACDNRGVWPVLVGTPGTHDTLLASPIILEDHPRVAPESPGDLFDGAEIDQLLRLSILSLTDEEKAEMRAADPRTRAILERTEALTPEELMRLHGTVRDLQVRP